MVFELTLLLFLFSLLVLGIAGYTDLKKRIVPNRLTFTAIAAGLAIQLLAGIYFNDLSLFYFALIAGIMTFACGYVIYRLGMWAGGDVKLFTAIAVLQPVNYGILRDLLGLNQAWLASISLPLFPLTLFFYSLLAMLPLGAVISLKAIAERKELRQKTIAGLKKKAINGIEFSLLVTGLGHFAGLA
ncbi:prepilin peptidase, partial [archaeon]|nr:prepilin peptidase [archaeon]